MKKLLTEDRVIIHYDQGQDYAFNGCMAYVMECLNESPDFDFWFFGGVSGDSFTQVYQDDLDIKPIDLSHSFFDRNLFDRVFEATGYSYDFVDPVKLSSDFEFWKKQIVASIDRGVPVVIKGFGEGRYPRVNIGCIVGYDDANSDFYYITQENREPKPFILDHDYTLAIVKEKIANPVLSETYKKAIFNIVALNTRPPENGYCFGSQAFEAWAAGIENGKYDDYPDEKMDLWTHYAQYLVIMSTNIVGQHFMNRARNLCPELLPLLDNIKAIVDEMYQDMGKLNDVGGGFDLNVYDLRNRQLMAPVCQVLRHMASLTSQLVQTIQAYC